MNTGNIKGYERVLVLCISPPSIFSINTEGEDFQMIAENLLGIPDGVQVDEEKNVIYWTNMGQAFPSKETFDRKDGSIEVMDLDGQNRHNLIGGGALTTPKQIFLDKESSLLYWCDREGCGVFRCKTDGSEMTTLIDQSTQLGDKNDIMNQCVGIALDRTFNRLIWTQKGPSKGGVGRILSAGLGVPEGENPRNRSDISILASSLPEPIDLEIDQINRKIYWTDRGSPPLGNSLNCANLTTSGLSDIKVVCNGFSEPIGLAIDTASDTAYVGDLEGNIWRVNLVDNSKKIIFKTSAVTGITLL